MRNSRRIGRFIGTAGIVLGGMVFQGCPAMGLLVDCFGEDTISRSEYEDMNPFERLLYEENSCDRYERRFDLHDGD